MVISTKNIDDRQFANIELREEDSLDRSLFTNNNVFYYTIKPPYKFHNQLIEYGFKQADPFFLYLTNTLSFFNLSAGFSFIDAHEVLPNELLGIGEEDYPQWLRHDYRFYQNALRSSCKFISIVVNDHNLIIGKVVAELKGNICMIRAIGVRSGFRGNGIGKALVSSLRRYNTAGLTFTALSLPNSNGFWQSIGFKKGASIQHWTRGER